MGLVHWEWTTDWIEIQPQLVVGVLELMDGSTGKQERRGPLKTWRSSKTRRSDSGMFPDLRSRVSLVRQVPEVSGESYRSPR